MYVCICNGFRDGELRALGAKGVRCPEAAYALLGSHPKCGACLETAKVVLKEACGAGVLKESCGANDTETRETEAA